MADFLEQVLSDEPLPEADDAPNPEPIEETVEEPVTPEPEPDPEPEPEPVVEEPASKGGNFVPIDAMLTERERRQAAERELQQLREQQTQQAVVPDPYDDPQGYASYQDRIIEEKLTAQRFSFSERLAKKEYGAEAVQAATEWAGEKAKADPTFAISYMREADPIDWIVQQHKRDALLSEIGTKSADEFVRDYLAKNPGLLSPSAPAQAATIHAAVTPAPKPVMPPRSIASDVSPAATPTNANPMADLDAIFNRR